MNRVVKGINQLKSFALAAVTFNAVFFIYGQVRLLGQSSSTAGLPADIEGFVVATASAGAMWFFTNRWLSKKT
jgi:hypothetical protein